MDGGRKEKTARSLPCLQWCLISSGPSRSSCRSGKQRRLYWSGRKVGPRAGNPSSTHPLRRIRTVQGTPLPASGNLDSRGACPSWKILWGGSIQAGEACSQSRRLLMALTGIGCFLQPHLPALHCVFSPHLPHRPLPSLPCWFPYPLLSRLHPPQNILNSLGVCCHITVYFASLHVLSSLHPVSILSI